MHAAWIATSNPGRGVPRSFPPQAANADWRSFSYAWVRLIGGWNSDGIHGEDVEALFPDLFEY